MARKTKYDLYAEILDLSKKGTKKTTLVYGTMSNFQQIKKYLHILMEQDLLKSNNGQIFTTSRGLEFIEKYEELMSFFD